MKAIKNLTVIALTAVLAFVFLGCSSDGGDDPVLPLPPAHEHAFATEWTSNETHHWHAATCGHTDQVKDKAEHDFPETWTEVTAATEEEDGLEERFCSVCEYRETRIILMLGHNHNVDRNNWTSDETNHWHAADCERPAHNEDIAPHTEDSGTVTTVPTCIKKGVRTYMCTVCNGVARTEEIPATGHTEDSGTVTKNVTLDTDGERTYKCTVCGNKRTEPITKPELYETPIDAETGLAAKKSSKYIYFGVFPKTVATENITVDENVFVTMGANTYYKGKNDENYYVKVKENAYGTGTEYKYSDGTQAKQSSSNSYRYFKVEPVKWKVITDSYSGKCLLLAEEILRASVPYHDTSSMMISGEAVYENNYKYSSIRAYLNGLDYYERKYPSNTVKKTDYTDKGFLQTAFTAEAQNLIAVTTVDNSAASTTDSGNKLNEVTKYACEDTKDKIFLLSQKEATSYGFPAYNKSGAGSARIRKPTDYAMANYAYQDSTDGYGGYWWLRSPTSDSSWAYFVNYNGNTGSINSEWSVKKSNGGVVPALSISLQ